MSDDKAGKPFTGRHMAMILIAFFGVVIIVNLVMARFAVTTFGGKVVENSYVASQHYNEWLERAEAQERLGWERVIGVDPDRHVRLAVRKDGAALTGLAVTATLNHPLGRAAPVPVRFVAAPDGSLRSAAPLPAGRWRIDLSVRHGADTAHYRTELQ